MSVREQHEALLNLAELANCVHDDIVYKHLIDCADSIYKRGPTVWQMPLDVLESGGKAIMAALTGPDVPEFISLHNTAYFPPLSVMPDKAGRLGTNNDSWYLKKLKMVKVLPCGMDKLLNLADGYYNVMYRIVHNSCFNPACQHHQTGRAVKLKRCGRCKMAGYCDRSCQQADWAVHGDECQVLQQLDEIRQHFEPADKRNLADQRS